VNCRSKSPNSSHTHNLINKWISLWWLNKRSVQYCHSSLPTGWSKQKGICVKSTKNSRPVRFKTVATAKLVWRNGIEFRVCRNSQWATRIECVELSLNRFDSFLRNSEFYLRVHTEGNRQVVVYWINIRQTPRLVVLRETFVHCEKRQGRIYTWMYKYPNRISYTLQLENGLSGDSGHISRLYRTASSRVSYLMYSNSI
jgi:hypothetical protein